MTTTTYSFLPNTPFTNSYSYDASGNVLNDGINTYAWNAESETKTAAGVNYIYDGLGNRVEKANGTLYWYGPGGEVLDETNLTGSLTSEYVFFAGKRVARRDASGNLYYYAEDFIGSSRVITQANGTLCSDADFLPFGQEVDYTSGCGQNYKFEGKERDIETGNDNFGARYYRSALGRWMSPDWSAIPAPVPYANLTNPQTLNLYAMVSDNPETFADLDGHLGGILEPIATNPNGLGPEMEVDSGWYEDQYGNIILGAPPDPTPQQPTTPPQNPTQAQAQQQNNSTPAKIVIVASDTANHGSYSTFTYQLENSSNKPLTEKGYGVEEHLFSDRAAHHHMEIGHNSEGKFVPATNGKVNDAVGYVAPGKGQKSYNVYQTFTLRYAGKNYNLHTEFEHETVVDKNRYINNVVVVQP